MSRPKKITAKFYASGKYSGTSLEKRGVISMTKTVGPSGEQRFFCHSKEHFERFFAPPQSALGGGGGGGEPRPRATTRPNVLPKKRRRLNPEGPPGPGPLAPAETSDDDKGEDETFTLFLSEDEEETQDELVSVLDVPESELRKMAPANSFPRAKLTFVLGEVEEETRDELESVLDVPESELGEVSPVNSPPYAAPHVEEAEALVPPSQKDDAAPVDEDDIFDTAAANAVVEQRMTLRNSSHVAAEAIANADFVALARRAGVARVATSVIAEARQSLLHFLARNIQSLIASNLPVITEQDVDDVLERNGYLHA